MNTKEQPQGLVKITGPITDYKVTRASASFVFTESDQTKMGVVAIAAGFAGLSGQAISTASNAMSVEEDADYVEFNLGGNEVKGWVWRSPFNEGDEVEVAAEFRNGHYEAAGILRPRDRTISLYPHCSRGVAKHITNAFKWWLIGTTMLLIVGLPFFFAILSWDQMKFFLSSFFGYIALMLYGFFGLMTFCLARKWMPFVRTAERVFRTLGFPDPGSVDLVKSSKASRRQDDPGEFGTFYFRY